MMATGLLALLSASAYGQISQLRADIPFEFRAGDQLLPAGEYRLNIDTLNHRVELRKIGGSGGAFLLTHQGGDVGDANVIVFYAYGKTHFLRSVRMVGSACAYEAWPTRAELEMAKADRQPRFALVRAGR
jgi:hypothetical protein